MSNFAIASIAVCVVMGGFYLYQSHRDSTEGAIFMVSDHDQDNFSQPDYGQQGSVASQSSSTILDAMTATDNTPSSTVPSKSQTLLVAGGCFWCVEADLEKLPGVISVVSGYADGSTDAPTYDTYARDGHREVVEVTYDASQVTFREILIYALKHMDPTDGTGSFHDRGEYYSPAFYYANEDEKKVIEQLISSVDEQGPYERPLAIDVLARPVFWPAEDYHQDYYKGTLSSLKYGYYRSASGRDSFIEQSWGSDVGPTLPWEQKSGGPWNSYRKPDIETLRTTLEPLAYEVTQEEGTERAGSSRYDKFWEEGIYVDILSGEPLFSSNDKYDSGTGWPSFVRPIQASAVTERIDKKLFSTRTEVRSSIADNHLGHVFADGPVDQGGLRYCMNGVALHFIPKAEMEENGYSDYIDEV